MLRALKILSSVINEAQFLLHLILGLGAYWAFVVTLRCLNLLIQFSLLLFKLDVQSFQLLAYLLLLIFDRELVGQVFRDINERGPLCITL